MFLGYSLWVIVMQPSLVQASPNITFFHCHAEICKAIFNDVGRKRVVLIAFDCMIVFFKFFPWRYAFASARYACRSKESLLLI